MKASAIVRKIRRTGGIRLGPEDKIQTRKCSEQLRELARENQYLILAILREEIASRRLQTCPECKAEFDSSNACANHMRFECPLWCPNCNKFIMRNGVCPGCELKQLKPEVIAQRCDENFRRLEGRLNLKPVSWRRMREITDGQPWQILPKNSCKTVSPPPWRRRSTNAHE